MSGKRKWLRFDVVGALQVCALAGVLAVGTVQAAPVRVESETNPVQDNAFTLDFGEFGDIDGLGALRTGYISSTDMEVEVDPDYGLAQFTRYDQDVSPIILPGGFDTGNIRVELVPGSSTGTFDRQTGVFVTNEEYAIYFEGDLSAFGLTSPVVLPSSSTGVVSLADLTMGSVGIEWNGETVIGGGENAIPIAYFCVVNNRFEPGVDSVLALDLGPKVLSTHMRAPYDTRLFRLVQMARRGVDYDRIPVADKALQRFVMMVEEGVRDQSINPADGADLIFDAEFALDLLPGIENRR